MTVSENRVNYKLFMIREEKQTKKSDSDRVAEDLYRIEDWTLLGALKQRKQERRKVVVSG